MSGHEAEQLARDWLTFARDDLAAAELLLNEAASPRIVCFHAQQAAEKAMKALLVKEQIRFERTHDLVAIRELFPAGFQLKADREALSALSRWAVEPRYPADTPDATTSDATAAIRVARVIVDAVVAALPDTPGPARVDAP